MIAHSMILLISTFAVVKCSTGHTSSTNKYDEEFEVEQPYIFPKIEDGNALQATLNLLQSQRNYQKVLHKLNRAMCDKTKKHEDGDLVEQAITGIIQFADELITNNTKIIQEYLKNGSADDDFKREPLSYQAARELTDCWKYIDDYITNYVIQFDLDVSQETDAMKKPVESAIGEIEEYNLYLDIVYEETEKKRCEQYFRYPKYGKWGDKRNRPSTWKIYTSPRLSTRLV